MTTFNVNMLALKATAIASSNEQTRYYLNGVCLEHTPSGLLYVATDGHRLIATRHDWNGMTPACFEPVIVPLSLIKKIKINRKIDEAEVTLEKIGKAPRLIRITYAGALYAEHEIDGSFPAWRRVIPQSCDGTVSQFNPDYLAAFDEAGRVLGNGKCDVPVSIAHNGGSPALVRFWRDENPVQSFGVIMPVRTNPVMDAPPSWATGSVHTDAPKAEPEPDATPERDVAAIALKAVEDAIG